MKGLDQNHGLLALQMALWFDRSESRLILDLQALRGNLRRILQVDPPPSNSDYKG